MFRGARILNALQVRMHLRAFVLMCRCVCRYQRVAVGVILAVLTHHGIGDLPQFILRPADGIGGVSIGITFKRAARRAGA